MLYQLPKVFGAVVVAYAAVYPFINEPKPRNDKSDNTKNTQLIAEPVKPIVKIEKKDLPDFAAIYDVKEKKRAFFGYLAPYVEEINQELLIERQFVKNLAFYPQNENNQQRLQAIAKRFRVKLNEANFADAKEQLLLRVDELPIELVLMQAANESAWGTSRFALQANNLFGQWCFKPGCGVVPAGRPEGERYEVRKFAHPIDSIRSYFHNLNTGHAYGDLRKVRKTLRDLNQALDPMTIAEGLLAYSTRREEYVNEIQKMISINKKYITTQVN